MLEVKLPFRFENMWLKAKDFKNLIDVWWKGIEVRGASNYVVADKLKAIKLKLKCWNKEVFERVDERKNQTLQNLAFWDTIGAQRPLTQNELERKAVEVEEFKKWALLEEIMWRQRSREV